MQNIDKWKPNRWLWNERKKKYEPNLRVVYPGSIHIATLQIDAVFPLMRNHITGRLLDCGCDVVPYYGIYKDLASDVVCIDWETTRSKNIFVDAFADLNKPLSFPDESFDTILLTDVLTHIHKPELLFSEFQRTLKPGGKIIVTHGFNVWLGEPPYEYGRFSEYALRLFCDDNNLKVLHLEPYGGRMDVLLDTLNKGMTGKISNRIFRLLRQLVISTPRYKRNKMESSKRHPIGYMLVAQKPSK